MACLRLAESEGIFLRILGHLPHRHQKRVEEMFETLDHFLPFAYNLFLSTTRLPRCQILCMIIFTGRLGAWILHSCQTGKKGVEERLILFEINISCKWYMLHQPLGCPTCNRSHS